MDLPPLDSHKDINTDMQLPVVKEEHIKAYVGKCQHESKLYDNGYVVYLRASVNATATHVRGQCCAEMKKGVAYIVDVHIRNDGLVVEAQCECAAGIGPCASCKHIVAMLFALHDFAVNGNVKLQLTCTQKLQTFHKAKPFMASPVKAAQLKIGHSNTNSEELHFDPRPIEVRNAAGYDSYVRNLTINYKSLNADSVPLLQLYEPANTYALENDHDYLENTLSENFLHDIHVTHITPEIALSIEKATKGQASNPTTWHAERCLRLHASKFGAICRARNKVKMAERLVLHVPVQAAALSHGRLFESTAVKKFEQLYNVTVQCGMGIIVSLNRPYLACSLDGIIDEKVLVEVKCPYSAKHSIITPETVPYIYLHEQTGLFSLYKTHNYYYQVQGQLFVTEKHVCMFVVFTFVDMLIIEIQRDDEFIAAMNADLDMFFSDYFRAALLNKYCYRDYASYDFGGKFAKHLV